MLNSKKILTLFLCLSSALVYAQVEQVTENFAGISRRLQFEIDNVKDPQLGYVPAYRLINAYQERKARIEQQQNLISLTWTERGPNSDAVGASNGNTRAGNGKTSGRVRAIWFDLADATGKTVWVGGIDGGLWKTNDISVNPATWTPINDFFGNLAVSSICQDPSNTNIMYFSTGEKALNADAVRGAGVWRSTDHGVTWSVMAGTSAFYNVSKIICDAAGNLYLGNNTTSGSVGMQRYNKAAATWDNITPSGLATRIPDIELSSTGRLHISCGYYNTAAGSAGYRYTDNPATVTTTTWTSPVTPFPTQYNVDLATNGNTLYALSANSAWQVPTIYKSTNGGANWAATGTTPTFTSGQAWYCMGIAVDPSNANNVIVGSLDCYKTTNGGTSWTKISEWVGTTGQYVHADQQAMLWRTGNQVLIASDGGVHYSTDGGTTITDRNQGLRIKQFYSVAIHPTSTNYFLAGAQDNGVHQLSSAGLGASVEVTGGDGAYVHIDQNQGQYQWGSYVYNQYRRSTNSGSTWTSVNYSSSAGRFINPSDYDDAANIMYASGNANTFVRWSNPQSGSTFTAVSMTGLNSGKVSAIKVSPYTSNTVYFGGGGSGVAPSLIKATAANATPVFTSIIGTGMNTSSANISSIELGTSEQNIIVCFSNYGMSNVWVTSNAGSTWTAIDGNLPDMPVRWAMFVPGSNTQAIIATETGIWQTDLINGSTTAWTADAGFPNVRVDMLQYRASDQLLAAATHGRGVFTTVLNAGPTCGTVGGLASSAITTSSATVAWTTLGGALNYDVDYKLNSSGTWTNAATATTATSVNLSGLTASSLYDWRVRANCSGATGAYAQAQFTTATASGCASAFEPNETQATAASITAGIANSAAISTSTDIDYFKVVTTATSNNTFSLAGPAGVDYDLVIYNSAGVQVGSGTSGTATETVSLTNQAAGTYYMKVFGYNGANSATCYTMTATVVATSCQSSYDNSTNGTISGAATIPFNTNITGLVSPTGDIDNYKFVITTAGTITLTLTTLPADYDLKLLNSAGTQVAISQNGSTTSESISYTAAAGTYYANAFGYNGANNASSCYTLKVQLGTATQQELDQPSIAVKVFPNPAQDKLTVYMIADNSEHKLLLVDNQGKTVYARNLTDMFTTLDIRKLAAGIYYVRVTDAKGNYLYTEKIVKQ